MWHGILAKLVKETPVSLVSYVRDAVLLWRADPGLWDAEWRCPVRLTRFASRAETAHDHECRAGFTAATVGQCMESHWNALKHALPSNCAYSDPAVAMKTLQDATMASAIQRGIVAIDARGRMTHIKTEVN